MSELNRQRLKDARKAAGLTQDEAGAALGLSRAFLSDIEKGKKTGSLDTLIQLAELYNVSLDFLCGLSAFPQSQREKDAVHKPDEVRLLAIWRRLHEPQRLAVMSDLALRLASADTMLVGHEESPKASSGKG